MNEHRTVKVDVRRLHEDWDREYLWRKIANLREQARATGEPSIAAGALVTAACFMPWVILFCAVTGSAA